MEVVRKSLHKCISEGLPHIAAWYHGTTRPKFIHKLQGMSFPLPEPKHCHILLLSDK